VRKNFPHRNLWRKFPPNFGKKALVMKIDFFKMRTIKTKFLKTFISPFSYRYPPPSSIFSFIITIVGDTLWSGKYGYSIGRGGVSVANAGDCTLDENIVRKIHLLKKPAASAARIWILCRSPTPLKMSKNFEGVTRGLLVGKYCDIFGGTTWFRICMWIFSGTDIY